MSTMILRTPDLGPPESYVEWNPDGEYAGMSNSDHTVYEGVEAKLLSEQVYTRYAGWNFNGLVWFDAEGAFSCQVWCWGSPQATVRAYTLNDIMREVSDEWGWE